MSENVKGVTEDNKLTEQQMKFCEEYVNNGNNGTKAAIDSGYSAHSASVQASRLLGKEKINDYINKLKEDAMNELGLDSSQVIRWVYELADKRNGAKEATRLKALELLMKHHGLLIDKKEITTDQTITIEQQAAQMTDDEITQLLNKYQDYDEDVTH